MEKVDGWNPLGPRQKSWIFEKPSVFLRRAVRKRCPELATAMVNVDLKEGAYLATSQMMIPWKLNPQRWAGYTQDITTCKIHEAFSKLIPGLIHNEHDVAIDG